MAVAKDKLPAGFEVWRQSRDYLYGWNWRGNGRKGNGYRSRKSAIRAAIEANSPCTCSFGTYCPHGRKE